MKKETNKVFKYSCFLSIILISTMFLNGAESEVYKVGDEEEWNTGINFLTWSEKYNFSVGDVLVFKYRKGQHDAYEVTEATYKSCNETTTGVLAKYQSGHDEVNLTEAKKYSFICNIPGHCLGGMRFTIDVKEASNTNNTTDIDSSTPPASSNQCFASKSLNLGMYFVGFVLILLKLCC